MQWQYAATKTDQINTVSIANGHYPIFPAIACVEEISDQAGPLVGRREGERQMDMVVVYDVRKGSLHRSVQWLRQAR